MREGMVLNTEAFSLPYMSPTGPVIPQISVPQRSPLCPLGAKGWGRGAAPSSPYKKNYKKPK